MMFNLVSFAWYIYVIVMFCTMLFYVESFLDFILLCFVGFVLIILPEIFRDE